MSAFTPHQEARIREIIAEVSNARLSAAGRHIAMVLGGDVESVTVDYKQVDREHGQASLTAEVATS